MAYNGLVCNIISLSHHHSNKRSQITLKSEMKKKDVLREKEREEKKCAN